VIMLVFACPDILIGETVSQSPLTFVGTQKDNFFPDAQFLQQLINLVIENNSILQSQKRVISEMELIPLPQRVWETDLTLKGGIGTAEDEDTYEIRAVPSVGLELEIPLYSPSRQKDFLQEKLAFQQKLEQAKQQYSNLKNSIVSDLLTKVAKLSQLDNQKKNLIELRLYLNDNLSSLEKQVRAGVIKPEVLWTLREKVMNLNIQVYNLSSQLKTLQWEMALTLAGEKWPEFFQMLDKLNT